jgi:C-terminal processing protease CtpA/Prc
MVLAPIFAPPLSGQNMSKIDRDLAKSMLENVSSDVRDHYFDQKLGGLDWDTLAANAEENIASAPNMELANAQIEGLLERLHDSHTFLIPPRNGNLVDYGWQFQIIGKRAYITQVEPGSDAEKQGMRAGDELLTINGFALERASVEKLKDAMYVFVPSTHVAVDLRDQTGRTSRLIVATQVTKRPVVQTFDQFAYWMKETYDEERSKYEELNPDVAVLRIPFFEMGDDVDGLFKRINSHKTLIVDLRGTPGGAVSTLESFLAHVFDRDVTVGEALQRGKTKPIVVKGKRRGSFGGDLIVLVDSQSASGAEIFARVVQIEQRGTILGDLSAGNVREARFFWHEFGMAPVIHYASEVAIADTIMADGKSLEGVGVQPDRTFLPTPADLAAGRDPALAYAASLAGVTLSPEDAAKLFPRPKLKE